MITDPMNTRVCNVNGASLVTSDNINVDTLSFGPGSKTARKMDLATNANTSLIGDIRAQVEHTVTKAGRRRSVLRFDVFSVADSTAGKTHTASAYLVVDQPDVVSGDAGWDVAIADVAISALLHSVVTSRAAGADIVESAVLNDFLNGEP